jgi:hypothetical protein
MHDLGELLAIGCIRERACGHACTRLAQALRDADLASGRQGPDERSPAE